MNFFTAKKSILEEQKWIFFKDFQAQLPMLLGISELGEAFSMNNPSTSLCLASSFPKKLLTEMIMILGSFISVHLRIAALKLTRPWLTSLS